MTTASVLWILGLAALGAEQEIDDFRYADAAAARQVWKAMEGTPAPEVTPEGGRTVLQVGAPFQSQPKLTRTVLDRRVKLDLSVPGTFVLEIQADKPEATAHLSFYFRSGNGWYSASGSVVKRGWQTIRLLKSGFGTEGQPDGWDHIDGIRIAVWNDRPVDAVIRLRRLTAVTHEVVLVVPARSRQPAGELKTAVECANRIAIMLDDLRLGCDQVDEPSVARGALGQRKVAILAYNPHLGDETVDALESYVGAGGKLIACYSLPPRLAKLLDVKKSKFVHRERPGMLAEMRFEHDAIPGLPERARQNSWNLTAVEPDAAHARVIGQWYDDQGQPAGHAALVLGRHGAFFSHVLLGDDLANKKQLLAALLGFFDAALWQTMVQGEMEYAQRIGPFESLGALEPMVSAPAANPEARRCFAAGRHALELAGESSKAGKQAQAMAYARASRDDLAQAYALAVPSRAREGRAVWNHSGTGAYPGDWERSARELAANGFNMIVPNMLWGGLAHYPSDILPRSAVFAEHGDQIAQCLAAARRHGLEVHVWKVNHNLSNAPKEFVEKLRAEKRLIVSARGETHEWLCPSNPENFKLEVDSMLEVARKYDVDGLHFDYIRYPGAEYCYCDGCRQRFEAASGRAVADWPKDCISGARREAYQDFRCQQITRLVEAVHREAKRIRPGIKISAAVFNSYPACRRDVGQDWVAWVKAGYLDFICPMDYTATVEAHHAMVENQLRLIDGRIPMYPGIGATASHVTLTADGVLAQIQEARALGAAGFTLFNYQPSTAEWIVPAIGLGAGRQKAVPPHR